MDKYAKWAAYEPEVQGVLIAFASVYGGTETAANILACRLAELGIPVDLYDVSVTHYSYVLSEAFKYSHLVFASTTYNNGIFVSMDNFLRDLAHHALRGRKVALIQNGSWAPASGKLMSEILCGMKDMELLEAPVTLKSTLAPDRTRSWRPWPGPWPPPSAARSPPWRRNPRQRTSPGASSARSAALSMSRTPSRRTSPVPSAAVPPATSSRWPDPSPPAGALRHKSEWKAGCLYEKVCL